MGVLRTRSACAIGRDSRSLRFWSASSVRNRSDMTAKVKVGIIGSQPGDAHDHLVARARLSELRDQRVAVIVPPALNPGLLADLDPRRLERCDRTRRIFGERRPEGEHKPLRPAFPEPADV